MIATATNARVFVDGTVTEPRLDHPEGVAVAADGSVWCGGERGQVYRVEPDGSSFEQVASTGGFCLGLAFGPDGALYVCDLAHRAVMRVEPETGRAERFAAGFRIPNFPAFDADGRLYVSDSHAQDRPGPGVYRVEPDGAAWLWSREPLRFANGLALAPGGGALYVAETFAHAIARFPIEGGPREEVARLPGVLPDGLAFDRDGRLYVGCYEPSQILRIDAEGAVEVLLHDPQAHLLCHPTNLAFSGTTLLAANLGRWHLTAIDVGVEGLL
jgi:gluconolactonase